MENNKPLPLGIIGLAGAFALIIIVVFLVIIRGGSTSSGNVPVAFDGNGVTSATIIYNFFGPVKSVSGTTTKTLTLNTPNTAIPQFEITNTTQLFNVTKNASGQQQFVKVGKSFLKTGQKVAVIAWYTPKNSKWITQYVYIQSYAQ